MSAPCVRAVTMMTGSCVWECVRRKPRQDVQAAQTRHLDVEQDEIERRCRRERERLGAVRRDGDVESSLPQTAGQRVAVGLVVVDDEQRAARSRRRSSLASSVSILVKSCSNRTGLVSKSSPPAASAISRSLIIACALRTMSGMCRVAASAFNCRVASQPSMPGRPRSIRMRSGSADRAIDTACSPSTASRTR